jgi:hypothetical protein
MNAIFTRLVSVLSLIASLVLATHAQADPLPGRDILKFTQQPMINTVLNSAGQTFTFNGHDEVSTAYSIPGPTGAVFEYRGEFMADDFADKFSSPVVHVKWWGSYLNRPAATFDPSVRRFLVSFESDIPAPVGGGFSRPGAPLLNQIVTLDSDNVLTPGSGTFTEKEVWPTSVDGPIYEYNAELHLGKEFRQQPDTVYWLKIVALVDAPPNLPADQRLIWGWHNRDYTKPNPLASTPPAVIPGEQIVGALPTTPNATRIWHFQDDAVHGVVRVLTPLTDPMSQIMPQVQQDVLGPTRYVAPYDGPPLINQFSKDLAFELYTVPEPAGVAFVLAGAAGVAAVIRRSRRGGCIAVI